MMGGGIISRGRMTDGALVGEQDGVPAGELIDQNDAKVMKINDDV